MNDRWMKNHIWEEILHHIIGIVYLHSLSTTKARSGRFLGGGGLHGKILLGGDLMGRASYLSCWVVALYMLLAVLSYHIRVLIRC